MSLCCRFFVALLVYLVGGTLLKHFLQGARGWEQIPNFSFWKDFPSLVRVIVWVFLLSVLSCDPVNVLWSENMSAV